MIKKFILPIILFVFLLASCSAPTQPKVSTLEVENQPVNENGIGDAVSTVEIPTEFPNTAPTLDEMQTSDNPSSINLPIVGVAEPTSQPDDPEVGSGFEAPQQVDDNHVGGGLLNEAPIIIDTVEVVTEESDMARVYLMVKGTMPSPCNLFAYSLNQPDEEGNINVRVYSMVDNGSECAQTQQPFEEQVDLGYLPSGNYSIIVNGNFIQKLEF